jgi:bifunctional non-homologous end joining protein LigD
VVPIERRAEWPDVKAFARLFAESLAKAEPGRFLTRISIAERRGRIFIDYLRNDPTSTAVAPYSTRSRAGAPVSTPLAWDELTPALDPGAFTLRTVPARLETLREDPWSGMTKLRQKLPRRFEA